MSNTQILNQNLQTKIVGGTLALVSALSIFAMLHHPSVSSVDIHQQIQEINQEATVNNLVHGILIAFVMIISLCLTHYAKIRGVNRNSVLFGIVVYWVASVVMILAALLSGIVGPQLAEHYQQASNSEAEVFRGITLLKLSMNQAFANFSVYCWCATMWLWSIDLLPGNKFVRVFALSSLLAACTTASSLLFGWISLNVFGMTVILIAVSVWQLGIASVLFFKYFQIREY